MLFFLCTAAALEASGDHARPIDLGPVPFHLDSLDEHTPQDPLEHLLDQDRLKDSALDVGERPVEDAHFEEAEPLDLHSALHSVHENIHSMLDVPEVPPGDDHDARYEALMSAVDSGLQKAHSEAALQAFHTAPSNTSAAEQLALLHGRLSEAETNALLKIGKSLKMMTVLHVLMQPMLHKLQVAAAHMPAEDQGLAAETLGHLKALDMFSEKATQLLSLVQRAAHGTKHEKDQAIKLLQMGLVMIKAGIQKHMQALKQGMVTLNHPQHGDLTKGVAGKLKEVIAKMQSKVDAELQDPARAHDPIVQLDVEMLKAMKKAVAKSEALVVVAAMEMKKDPGHSEQFKVALKASLHAVTDELRSDMDTLKKKAMMIAVVHKVMAEKKHEKEAAEAAVAARAPGPDDGDENPETDEQQAPKKPSPGVEDALGLAPPQEHIGHAPAEQVPKDEDSEQNAFSDELDADSPAAEKSAKDEEVMSNRTPNLRSTE